MALGISFEVIADVIMLPAEALCPRAFQKDRHPFWQCQGRL